MKNAYVILYDTGTYGDTTTQAMPWVFTNEHRAIRLFAYLVKREIRNQKANPYPTVYRDNYRKYYWLEKLVIK